MIEIIALAIVVATGTFFVALGGTSLFAPSHASRFLLAFAGSPTKHYAELGLRFLVGGAFVFAAPYMRFPVVFSIFGWVMVATTTGLLLIPWHWHHRFAQTVVPATLRFLPLVGAVSIALGVFVLVAVFRGNAT